MESLKSLSYISQRVTFDAIDKAGDVLNIPITKKAEDLCFIRKASLPCAFGRAEEEAAANDSKAPR